ncbi:MAG: NADH-quinone oxidoreductase subunit J [Opitutae bacterium]|nr:NADH-quinone oxidoreductase subunit J [Opitutae bacterium]
MAELIFYFFAALTAGGALGVVLNRNTVAAALCLLLSLMGLAGLFVLLDAYLLAALLLLVYAGAVAALFLFVVMLLDMQGGAKRTPGWLNLGASAIGFAVLLAGVAATLARAHLPEPVVTAAPSFGFSLKYYAAQLFTTYLLPVQIIGFLLLIAMLGVIVISKKPREEQTPPASP